MSSDASDRLLAPQNRKEALSRVYARAVAAGAGYVVSDDDFDTDGVDLQIRAGGDMRPALDLQLKATVNLSTSVDGHRQFRLKRRNYDLLRISTMIPRLLVVLDLPKDENCWITLTPEQLVLRRCAYWLSLTGSAKTDNQRTITVKIPERHVFDIAALRMLMNQVRKGRVQ